MVKNGQEWSRIKSVESNNLEARGTSGKEIDHRDGVVVGVREGERVTFYAHFSSSIAHAIYVDLAFNLVSKCLYIDHIFVEHLL